jgi:outer membrane biosynthesis protein TonB
MVFFVFAGAGGAAAAYFLWYVPYSESEDDAVAQAEAAANLATRDGDDEEGEPEEPAPENEAPENEAPENEAPPPEPPPAQPEPVPVAEPEPEPPPPQPEPPPPEPVVQPPPPQPPPPQPPPPQPPPPEADPNPQVAQRPQSLDARVRAAARQVSRQCFMLHGAHGAVMLEVAVGVDGRVTATRVLSNGTGYANVASCISSGLVGRRIDPEGPPGGARITVQFSG